MGSRGSAPTVEVDQCEEMDKALKEEYGDDYKTNREKFPLTAQALSMLASTPCESYFGYDALVREYCGDVNHFADQIGNGQTCADRTDTSMRSRWCLMEDEVEEGQEEPEQGTRLKTNGKCSKTLLADKYDSTATAHCQRKPDDEWCVCYNVKNKVCDTNPSAAGCKYYETLEANRVYFGEEPEIENPDNPGEMIACDSKKHGPCPYSDGYKILKEYGHCRPRVCDRGYIPTNVTSDCASSHRICKKDLNINSMSNSDIIVECNGDLPPFVEPDWWGDESTTINDRCKIDVEEWFSKITGRELEQPEFGTRKPGFMLDFNKFPLSKTPMTCLPGRLKWRDRNTRYLAYTGVSSVSLCCCCILLILLSLKRR
jgi:hypothetical protein